MNESLSSAENKEDRLEWVEPQIHELEIGETKFQIGVGADGAVFPPDCTLS